MAQVLVATAMALAAWPAAGSLPGVPVATARIDAASQAPVVVDNLIAGRAYRLEVSGTYRWGCEPVLPDCSAAYAADAECSEYGTTDPAWRRYRFGAGYGPDTWGVAPGPASDPLDLQVDGLNIEWQPGIPVDFTPGGAACADGPLGVVGGAHTYEALHVATSSAMTFIVADGVYADNAGELVVAVHDAAG